MSLLQAMTASKSELMQKLAGVYRQHGLTDAQAATDLLGVVELFPEVADEIPGFEKVAANKLAGQGMSPGRVLRQVMQSVPTPSPALLPRSALGPAPRPAAFPVPAAASGVPQVPMAARTQGLSPRLVPQAAPAVPPRVPSAPAAGSRSSVPAPKPAPGLKPIDQERLAWEEDRVWRAQSKYTTGRAGRTTYSPQPAAAPDVTPPVGTPASGSLLQRRVVQPILNAPRDAWNNKGRFAGGLALSGGIGGGIGAANAFRTGEDPLMGFAGGAVPSMVGSVFMQPSIAGLTGGLTSSTANGTGLTEAAQAQLRQNTRLPDFMRDWGIPRDFTGGMDPTRATSAAQVDAAATEGGERLNRLRSTMLTPRARAAQAAQEAAFTQKALDPEIQKAFPEANPRAALDYTLPLATDPVLNDPALKAEIADALSQPGKLEAFGKRTTAAETELVANIPKLDPMTAKFELSNLAKRRMAFTAAATGTDIKTLVRQANDLDARLQANEQLTTQDLDLVLRSPNGREFFKAMGGGAPPAPPEGVDVPAPAGQRGDAAERKAVAEEGAWAPGFYPAAEVPSLGTAAALPRPSFNDRGYKPTTVPIPYQQPGVPALGASQAPAAAAQPPNYVVPTAPAPAQPPQTGGAPVPNPTGDPAAPQDMSAVFQRIGEFAANNKVQFAALALGIPIALSGLAMTMSGGASLGSILAMILGGGIAAGGMGQFGGTDLMSPLQQFFGGKPAAPAADPNAAPPAAPEGGAAAPTAAPFQVPNIGDAVSQPQAV